MDQGIVSGTSAVKTNIFKNILPLRIMDHDHPSATFDNQITSSPAYGRSPPRARITDNAYVESLKEARPSSSVRSTLCRTRKQYFITDKTYDALGYWVALSAIHSEYTRHFRAVVIAFFSRARSFSLRRPARRFRRIVGKIYRSWLARMQSRASAILSG